MKIKYEIEVSENIEGTIEVDGPIADHPDEAERFARQLLEELYPDADFIELDVI